MTGKPRTPAYYTVARGLYEHPDFIDNRRLSRREAWQWLIERAAWKPRGDRMSRGVATLERGQAAVTIRGLAEAWGWPRGNVEYFLHWLEERERITRAVSQTKIQTKSQTRLSYRATVITICNYDKFQGALRAAGVRQSFGQSFSEEAPELPGIVHKSALEPLNHPESIYKSKEAVGTALPSVDYGDKSQRSVDETMPRHGLRTRKKGVEIQFWQYGTDQWEDAADFAKAHRNVETFPTQYRNGRGNWFRCRTFHEAKQWAIQRAKG